METAQRPDAHIEARRRAPFFHERWNETYGWQVAASLAAFLVCAIAFAVIGGAVTEHVLITSWDVRLNRWLHVHQSAPLTHGFEWYTHLGSFPGLAAVVLVAVILLARRRAWSDALLVVLALTGAAVINPLFKEAFARPRPHFHDPGLTLQTFSFPSGHAMGSAAVFGAVAIVVVRRVRGSVWAPLAVAAAAAVVLLVGISRVYLGVHYPSDVAGGFALGLAWGLVCVLGLTIRERRRAPPSSP